ncbi:hypothetical protein FB451DRAFT_1441811 [Mycena latifolia]|nr:hypothetical protein FB451DRAFT_1441811 [Mycena latifolia]
MARHRTSVAPDLQELDPSNRINLQLVAAPSSKDWLAEMLVAARTIAIGAELIPIPCVRVAFGTAVLFLETVNRIKRNREDLKDLCGTTLEIMMILREGTKDHEKYTTVRFAALVEDFISTLGDVHDGLERFLQQRRGLRGAFQQFLRTTSIAEEITRYRIRIQELRLNFLRVRIFIARISGEASLMTVAQYENGVEWQNDLILYSALSAPAFRALIFHEELIPLPIYRQNHRPQSDLVWACVEAMLVSHAVATCVKREPVGICLTMPCSDLECDVNPRERLLSLWHSSYFSHRAPTGTSPASIACAPTPKDFVSRLSWEQFLAMLTPAWLPDLRRNTETQFFLGSIVTGEHLDGYLRRMSPVAHLDNSSPPYLKQWTLGPPPKSSPSDPYDRRAHSQWQRLTFPPGSFKGPIPTSQIRVLMSTYIEFDPVNAARLNLSWLAQANACVAPALLQGEQPHGVVDTLGSVIVFDPAFDHILHAEGTPQETRLRSCIGVEVCSLIATIGPWMPPEPADYPLKNATPSEFPDCGLVQFAGAIREFARSKGVDLDSQIRTDAELYPHHRHSIQIPNSQNLNPCNLGANAGVLNELVPSPETHLLRKNSQLGSLFGHEQFWLSVIGVKIRFGITRSASDIWACDRELYAKASALSATRKVAPAIWGGEAGGAAQKPHAHAPGVLELRDTREQHASKDIASYVRALDPPARSKAAWERLCSNGEGEAGGAARIPAHTPRVSKPDGTRERRYRKAFVGAKS